MQIEASTLISVQVGRTVLSLSLNPVSVLSSWNEYLAFEEP